MGKALYRKYRSKSLDEIVGQKHVTDILARALKQGRTAHAYLLTGPRGTGKTSIARILAHEINALPYTDESTHLDIIEIDAASNNGVDDVRDLRDKVQIAPVSAAKKVYIIDEVHMLSKAAFNALLKTLEEPPEHIVFIMATTNVEKLPDTIISRTQRFGLRLIAQNDIMAHLKHIANSEKITITDDALEAIAKRGGGSFRDSISLLDQLSSLADDKQGITLELVESTLGLAPHTLVTQLIDATLDHDAKQIIDLLGQSEATGVQPAILIDQLVDSVRTKLGAQPHLVNLLDNLLSASDSSKPDIKLLTVLLSHAAPKPKTAALTSPTPSISAPVDKIVSPTTPIATPPPDSTPERVVTASSEPAASISKPLQPEVEATLGPEFKPGAKPFADTSGRVSDQTQPEPTIPDTPPTPENFDWPALVEYVRVNHVALHSVLSKCTPEIDGTTLRLYAMRKFNKTKLDDAKYRTLLAISLQKTGAGSLDIETIPTPPPPTDSTAAAVAAIMGGGEQVNVEG